MGYQINSPVKQVWLPIDHDFIGQSNDDTFSNFSKRYKEKYGIDLHDIFYVSKNQTSISVTFKEHISVGGYSVNNLYGAANNIKCHAVNCVIMSEIIQRDFGADSEQTLITIWVGDTASNIGSGFALVLPANSQPTMTLDDLIVKGFEI